MAYQGLSPVNKTLSTATQYFSGDGTTRQFTLTQGVSQASDLIVMVGSTLQIPGINYTAASTTITFAVGNAPTAGTNNISVTYIAGNLTTLYITANAYPAGTNVAPSIYTTAAASTGIYWPSTNTLGFTASGNTRVIVSDVANGVATSPSTGALQVNGGLGVTGAHYVGGVLYASSGTASTNQSTGALVVSGGIGASGAMYLGGSLTIAGGLTVAGSFNTTSTNSLTVNDPFLFLANTNVGNAVDIGVVGTYNDGLQRYEGLYRTAADGRFRLFTNLATPPGTLVTTTDGTYRYADLWLGNANVTATAQSVSSLTGALTVWGGIGAQGTMYVNGQNNTLAIGNGGTSGVGNIGASGATFNTIFASATTAQYADLAEKYIGDAAYAPGTVVSFGGTYEVTQSVVDMDPTVAGVVSTKPGFLMNEDMPFDSLNGQHSVSVALTGRVPTRVQGKINKGDMLVSAGNGYARAELNPRIGTVIGKALENFTGTQGIIEVVIGRF